MTKAELIAVVGEKADLTKKDADKAVSAVLEAITETLVNGASRHSERQSDFPRRNYHCGRRRARKRRFPCRC